LVLEQVLQNAPHFAFFSGIYSETEVSEQLYLLRQFPCLPEEERQGRPNRE
jgi:hypothetical protein